MRRDAIFLASLLLAVPAPASEPTLSLYTFESPPYQSISGADSQRAPGGTTVETIECVLEAMDWQGQITVVPKKRGLRELRQQSTDGFFPLRRQPGPALNAKSTDPISLHKWYFFGFKEAPGDRDQRVGARRGGGELVWLERMNYPRRHTVASNQQLLQLLAFERVEAILGDWQTILYEINRLPDLNDRELDMASLNTRFVRFTPQHLYLSNDFLDRHPDFMETFNRHLKPCVVTHFELTDEERERVRQMASDKLNNLSQTMDLREAVNNRGLYESGVELLVEDRIWETLSPDQTSLLAKRVLEQPLSRQLAQWKTKYSRVVTEVFLMDRLGALTATSQLTSDFWQANELKYQGILELEHDEFLLYPLYFDESTARFQIMVASPVRGDAGEFLGGVALGLDVERALFNGPQREIQPVIPRE